MHSCGRKNNTALIFAGGGLGTTVITGASGAGWQAILRSVAPPLIEL